MRPGRAADHSSPSSAAVMEELSYTSTHTLCHAEPVTGSLYLYCMYLCLLTRIQHVIEVENEPINVPILWQVKL